MKTKKNGAKLVQLLLVCALLVTVVSGCGAENNAGGPEGAATTGASSPGASSSSESNENERVVIMGEIVETIGNMVTLNLIERVEIPQMTEEEMAELRESFPQNEDGTVRREMTDDERAAMLERFNQSGDGTWQGRQFTPGESGMPEGFPDRFAEGFTEGFPEGFPEGFTGGMPGGRGQNYTGESREIIIPAGAPVLESTYTNGEQVESEITLDKLKTGDIIEVTYASDGETVSRVVKQSTTQSMTRYNVDGSGNYGGFRSMPGGDEPLIIPNDGVGIPLPQG